jgi:hypothetical protein
MLLTAAATLTLLAGCGFAPRYPQFGQAEYRLEGATSAPGGGSPTHTVIYRQGPKMRLEAALPHYGQAVVVFDQSTNASYVLNPTAPIVAANAPGTAAGASAAAQTNRTTVAAAPTSDTPSNTAAPAAVTNAPHVAGVAIRLADADAPQPLETAWTALGAANARSVGSCRVAGERGHEWRPKQAPAPGVERTACITDDGIVLRVRENDRVLWEAASLQRGPQQASLFGVPSGYQLIDPDAIAGAMSDRMDNLNSVTGASPATQQAPTPPPPG